MNRQQRRKAASQGKIRRSEICIFCELADGTMTVQDFARHCREVAHMDDGLLWLDEITQELQEHPRLERALADECAAVAYEVRLAHSAAPAVSPRQQ
jgi:hypothetical protein